VAVIALEVLDTVLAISALEGTALSTISPELGRERLMFKTCDNHFGGNQ
jgi:hypothetical protein